MRRGYPTIATVLLAASAGLCCSQTPVLGNIETPYAPLQLQAQIANTVWAPGSVAYGPPGTPVVLTGSNLGGGGVVRFWAYKNGVVDTSVGESGAVPAVVTLWTSNMLILTVPSAAYSGIVTVTVEGKTSNGLPFMVTPGSYATNIATCNCPPGPTGTQLQITTSSLHDGAVNQSYDASLGANGGTQSYTWSIVGGTLPSGLTLGSSTGTISGTPTSATGQVSFTVQVTDSSLPSHQIDQAILTMAIEPQTMTSGTIYNYNLTYDAVGNVTSFQDHTYNGGPGIMGTWSMTGAGGGSGYDALNRLASASVTWPNGTQQYMCWSYDAYGNRLQQEISNQAFTNSSGGANQCTAQSSAWVALDSTTIVVNGTDPGTNRVQSTNTRGIPALPGYDASGNMTSDGGNTYLYDGEGRVCAVQNATFPGITTMTGYLYDAEGNRVAKGTINLWNCDPTKNGFQFTENYALGAGGEELTMLDGTNHWQRTNVYAAGRLLATYDMVGNPSYTLTNGQPTQIPGLHFHIEDPLGTRRMQISGNVNNLGQPETDFQSLPFGDRLAVSPDPYADQTAEQDSLGATPLFFTGKERDTESGNDYFGKRYYASSMGRWMSPDRINVTEDRMMNPANTLNKYAYAADNPLKYVDPDGQDITIYYEAGNPYPGHTMLLAYNQETGDSATRSFGPDHSRANTFETAVGIPVPGTDRFGFEDIKSPDDLRKNFASYTIQTTPEEAQEVIDAIRAHPDGDYTTYWNNCTTSCSKLLRLIKQSSSHALTPVAFFHDIWGQEHGGSGRYVHSFDRGQDYGHPRQGYDPFQMFFWLMGSNDKSSVTTTETYSIDCQKNPGACK
jgi:RHS repeat-associated protein